MTFDLCFPFLQDTKDDSSSYICPLCDKSCQTQHQLTMHIRQVNTPVNTPTVTADVQEKPSVCQSCCGLMTSSIRDETDARNMLDLEFYFERAASVLNIFQNIILLIMLFKQPW